MPSLNSPVLLQLQLKALLEDLDPGAFIIEMIAMLFVETLMGQRGRLIFKSRQSFPKSNYGKSVLNDNWREPGHLCTTPVSMIPPKTSIRGIMSDPIDTDIIIHKDKLRRHRHNGMITHSYDVGMIRTELNKNRGQRMKYTWHSVSLFHLR